MSEPSIFDLCRDMASEPSPLAMQNALKAVSWAASNGLRIVQSSAQDTFGEYALYLEGDAPGRQAWLSIADLGGRLALSEHGRVTYSGMLVAESWDRIRAFLDGGSVDYSG